MRYAFVFVSIVAIWLALLLLALRGGANPMFIYGVVMLMTIVLYWIGFRGNRR